MICAIFVNPSNYLFRLLVTFTIMLVGTYIYAGTKLYAIYNKKDREAIFRPPHRVRNK